MLKLKYLFENFELAKFALENWNHDKEFLDEYLKYFRVSSNAVYPFESEGKRCFLRLAPVEEKQKENLVGDLEFLNYLNKAGYNAMKPVASKNGEYLLTLDSRWGVYYASVFEGVLGRCIEDTDYSETIMFAYGKALGRLHCLSMAYEPQNRKWSYIDALAWVKEVFVEHQKLYPEKYPELEKMQREAEQIEKELSNLKQTNGNYGLVHYDFEPDNVFYDEKDDSCHVIDFEDGMYHFYLLDIEQVLDALSNELEGDVLTQAKRNFLKGYANEKALDQDYEKQLPLMRRFCNLFSYARLIRCVAEEVPDAPEWMVRLKNKLTEKIRSLEY